MTEQRHRGKYPEELRESAVRIVFEAQQHGGSQRETISSVAEKLGPTPETVRKRARRVSRPPTSVTPLNASRQPRGHRRYRPQRW